LRLLRSKTGFKVCFQIQLVPLHPGSPGPNQVSVYVGVGSQDFMGHVLSNCYHAANPYMITGNMTSVAGLYKSNPVGP
jgi:hypothetical protein